MLVIFAAFVAIVLGWAVVLKIALSRDARERERAREETRVAVQKALGLEIDGDPLKSCSMRGEVHGVDLTIERGTSRSLSPRSESSRSAAVIAGRVALPDQIVCRKEDADEVMGPLPSVPRQATDVPTFDRTYSVFVGVDAPTQQPHGYRDSAGDRSALAWADPKTLADMISQRLIFMRVHDGRVELAFDPRPAEDVAPLVATAANVVRRATGQPLVSTPTERPVVTPPLSYDRVTVAMGAGVVASIFVGPFGMLLAFLPPLRELNAEAQCGKGAEILVSSSDTGDGTGYGLYCSNDMHAGLFGHYASALALFFSLLFGAVTVIGLLRWPKRLPI